MLTFHQMDNPYLLQVLIQALYGGMQPLVRKYIEYQLINEDFGRPIRTGVNLYSPVIRITRSGAGMLKVAKKLASLLRCQKEQGESSFHLMKSICLPSTAPRHNYGISRPVKRYASSCLIRTQYKQLPFPPTVRFCSQGTQMG